MIVPFMDQKPCVDYGMWFFRHVVFLEWRCQTCVLESKWWSFFSNEIISIPTNVLTSDYLEAWSNLMYLIISHWLIEPNLGDSTGSASLSRLKVIVDSLTNDFLVRQRQGNPTWLTRRIDFSVADDTSWYIPLSWSNQSEASQKGRQTPTGRCVISPNLAPFEKGAKHRRAKTCVKRVKLYDFTTVTRGCEHVQIE